MSRDALLVSLFLAGIGMRMPIVAIGPLLPQMRDDLAISFGLGGLLVTLPVLCMGLIAIPAGLVADRWGARGVVAACLAALAGVGLLRALAPEALLVVALTVPIGLAIGLGGPLLSVVAKRHLPLEPATATGAYVAGFILGSTLASALAVPIADLFGTWRAALGLFALVTAPLVVIWLAAVRGEGARPARKMPRTPLPWRRPIAWLVAAPFALQSVLFFGLVTWLPAVYVEQGWSAAAAGVLVAVFVAIGLPVTLVVGWLADRVGSRRMYLVLASALVSAGGLGLIILPEAGLLWAIASGIGLGILFPLGLTLPLDVSESPAQAGMYVGMVLALGYLLAGLAPSGLGVARDAFGSFTSSLFVLAAIALACLASALLLTPERLARERRRLVAAAESGAP